MPPCRPTGPCGSPSAPPTSSAPAAATDAPGLDLSAFRGVVEVRPGVDGGPATALVGGLTTYEQLVDELLPHGYVPLVVPQLRTITIGGAVTGLGIEAVVVPQRPAPRVGARDADPHR